MAFPEHVMSSPASQKKSDAVGYVAPLVIFLHVPATALLRVVIGCATFPVVAACTFISAIIEFVGAVPRMVLMSPVYVCVTAVAGGVHVIVEVPFPPMIVFGEAIHQLISLDVFESHT